MFMPIVMFYLNTWGIKKDTMEKNLFIHYAVFFRH